MKSGSPSSDRVVATLQSLITTSCGDGSAKATPALFKSNIAVSLNAMSLAPCADAVNSITAMLPPPVTVVPAGDWTFTFASKFRAVFAAGPHGGSSAAADQA